jgi:hypothetical protein
MEHILNAHLTYGFSAKNTCQLRANFLYVPKHTIIQTKNIQNTRQKYTDMCLYVVSVVVCTETYFMLQICMYWYIIDTYMINCGQLWSVFVHIYQYILLIEWIWQGLMHTYGKPSQANEPLHCNSKGSVY